MKRTACIVGILVWIVCSLPAQDTEPQDPGIVLPPVLLEIEDLQVEDVNAALPADEDQLRPEVSIPLPEAEALYLPDEVFDIPYPDQVGVTPGGASATYAEYLDRPTSQIFSDGRIGVGAPIHVLGDLTLYKLGEEPRFRLRFFHEKLDGYGFKESGAGFFDSRDVLDGTLSFEGEATSFEVTGEIGESSQGLQRQLPDVTAEYDAVTRRDVAGVVSLSHALLPVLTLSGDLDVSYGTQILSAETPLLGTEFAVAPAVRLGLALEALELSVTGGYELVSTSASAAGSIDHRVEAMLGGAYRLANDLTLFLDGGIYWSPTSGLLPDVMVGANGRVGTLLQFQTQGGYTVRPARYQHVWEASPLVAISTILEPEFGWSWDGTVQIRPLTSLLLTTGLGFDLIDGVLDPVETPDATTGLFGFTTRRLMTLETDLSVEWDISTVFGLDLAWRGAFFDRTRFEPVQSVALTVDAEDPGERFGGLLATELEFDPGIGLPVVGFGGFYRLSDSVSFELEVRDLLAPLLTPGRYDWEPYIRPGLNAMLLTKISL